MGKFTEEQHVYLTEILMDAMKKEVAEAFIDKVTEEATKDDPVAKMMHSMFAGNFEDLGKKHGDNVTAIHEVLNFIKANAAQSKSNKENN